MRPTLYDFLAHRSLDFFMSSESYLTQPSYAFEMNDSAYFGEEIAFMNMKVETKDSMSMKFQAIKILQTLTRAHVLDANPAPMIDIQLKRLGFMKSAVKVIGSNELYLKALRVLYAKNKNIDVGTEIAFAIASYYQQRATGYVPNNSQDHKWELKKSLALCDSAIKAFPSSHGGLNCSYLKSQILIKSYNITTDDVILPGTVTTALIQYKNVDKLYFRLCKVDYEKHRKMVYRKYGKDLGETAYI